MANFRRLWAKEPRRSQSALAIKCYLHRSARRNEPFRSAVIATKESLQVRWCPSTVSRQCAASGTNGVFVSCVLLYCCSSDVSPIIQAARVASGGRCCKRRFLLVFFFPSIVARVLMKISDPTSLSPWLGSVPVLEPATPGQ